ncbi:MAG: histidinol-phosphatase HisJ family protein [Blautia sp.]|nr:histidinol-phosphatase HisJ family protein [Blautia sp.]
MRIRANFHTHTSFCDGRDTAQAMAEQACAIGFNRLGFSGHMDADIHMDLAAYQKEIFRLREVYAGRLEIFCGVELDNLYDPSVGEGMDYVIGSTHFLDVPSEKPMSVDAGEEEMETLAMEFFDGDYYALARAYYELEAKVYDRLHCTFVGHFDLVTRFNDSMHFLDEEDPRYTGPALDAMEYLVSKDIPFEINCGAVNRGRKKELYPHPYLLRKLKELGGEIVISSDAHQKELLDGGFELAIGSAISCGFTHINLLKRDWKGRICWEQQALR